MAPQPLGKLTELDPQDAWRPVEDEEWNLKWAAHLYRRGAFGAPPARGDKKSAWESLQAAVAQGREACVAQLLRGAEGAEAFNELIDSLAQPIAGAAQQQYFGGLDVTKLMGWWLYRMLHTPHPLQERMTLLWHSHFATSIEKVAQPELMLRQNKLLRRLGMGKFGPLADGISRDPAMLIWLDSNRNVKGSPNENFPRELMELFTLGTGNYTERDVRELARVLTGWGTNSGEFAYNRVLHDEGSKTILGETGNFDGDDVVRILLAQPAAPRMIASKLYRNFVSNASPPPPLLDPLAAQLRETEFDIAAALGLIFRSRLFYSQHAYRQCVKSPVEYVVSLVRAFDGQPPIERLATAMEGLGQILFQPPNVKGWEGGTAWLSSATLLSRHNLAWKLLGPSATEYKIDPKALAEKYRGQGIGASMAFFLKLLLQDDVPPKLRQRMVSADADLTKKYHKDDADRIARLAHVITTIPEYQLA